ncbi:unnamed protein product [Lactuca virosa]|uniref:Uncharacterized protein n=1 Tax=Lactuca virosa TaxID=75947 RepID=A0AAU9PKJ1_9ASTR|nr:unnamed protein product [Lactuca virosa]
MVHPVEFFIDWYMVANRLKPKCLMKDLVILGSDARHNCPFLIVLPPLHFDRVWFGVSLDCLALVLVVLI